MEAIQALQLQTDAKHRRITDQVMKKMWFAASEVAFFVGCCFEICQRRWVLSLKLAIVWYLFS